MNVPDDIAAAIRNGSLLSGATPIAGAHLHIATTFADAEQFAYHRLTDDELTWADLRAHEVSLLLGSTYAMPDGNELRAHVRSLGQALADLVIPALPEAYARVADDVIGDLQNVVLARRVPGAGTGLFGRLWDVYRAGAWPCGWIGAHPDGQLVVFRPPARPNIAPEPA
jgi:hypothetical protein